MSFKYIPYFEGLTVIDSMNSDPMRMRLSQFPVSPILKHVK